MQFVNSTSTCNRIRYNVFWISIRHGNCLIKFLVSIMIVISTELRFTKAQLKFPNDVHKTTAQSFLAGTKFSDLINANVNIVVDPLRVIFEDFEENIPPKDGTHNVSRHDKHYQQYSKRDVSCVMTIHRNHCAAPKIKNREQIAWDTRICFRWKCSSSASELSNSSPSSTPANAYHDFPFAMRVENCWTGSIRNPIFIIGKTGCTNEQTMVSSPRYNVPLTDATAVGWLSVRLAGINHIRLACAVRLCDICDKRCALLTPPKCRDHHNDNNTFREGSIWRKPELLESICNPSTLVPQLVNAASKNVIFKFWLIFHIFFVVGFRRIFAPISKFFCNYNF